ncbi:MAG: S1C family serine protease [Candidatus Promineifilaceae bacterium]|jgi:S1-C subfamily serine protease
MSSLEDLSSVLTKTVENTGPAVVRIDARRRFPATGFVWSKDGLIVTASHVIRRDGRIGIGLEDGKELEGQLIGRDPSTDLALIKVDATGLAKLEEAVEENVKVGNLVLALGRPGKSVQATLGVISALGSAWRTRHGGQADKYIQTDVLMYPGFSGGPLVTASGALVGLNSSALMHGASITLPTSTITRVINALQQYGRVRRGYLGVSTQVVHLQEDVREELGQKSGLLIVAVETGSPADEGGLTIGDTIVQMGSTTIRRHDDLLAELMRSEIDAKVPVTIVRGGEVQTLNVKIGQQD